MSITIIFINWLQIYQSGFLSLCRGQTSLYPHQRIEAISEESKTIVEVKDVATDLPNISMVRHNHVDAPKFCLDIQLIIVVSIVQ